MSEPKHQSNLAADVTPPAAEVHSSARPKRTHEELVAIIRAAREEYQAKNPGRDPLEEF
jgi:hypothetical protein